MQQKGKRCKAQVSAHLMGSVKKGEKYEGYYYLKYFSRWYFNQTLSIYQRSNVPVFSERTWTLFLQPHQICSARLPAL